ncbi:MAG TPA: CHAD domain-containing protein, partial [Polyangiaceae bacterium]|nr:CHAD domain-containing protein [Polyangiaceae bacterium]
ADCEQDVSLVASRLLELPALDGSRAAVAAALRGALAERHLDAERQRRDASAEHPKSLHRLRLTLKRYRYGLDALGAALPPEGQQASRALALMQDQLGSAHDALVLAETARSWAKKRRKLFGLAQALRQSSREAQVAGAEAAAHTPLSWPFAEKAATPESLR